MKNKNYKKRMLGALEKVLWLYDYINPRNFAIVAEVSGSINLSSMKNALLEVQKRHLNLTACIRLDDYDRPVFHYVPEAAIPLHVVGQPAGEDWQRELMRAFSRPFDHTKGPLVRVTLIQQPEDAIIIMYAHHAISDGKSIVFVMNDLLKALSGEKLYLSAIQPSLDELLGLPDDVGMDAGLKYEVNSSVADFSSAVPLSSHMPQMECRRFSEELTNNIIQMCRRERTTIHGALSAAMLIAARRLRPEWSERELKILSPVSPRKTLHIGDECGLYLTLKSVFFEYEPTLSFWEIARIAKVGLLDTDTKAYVSGYIEMFRQFTFNTRDIAGIINILKSGPGQELMISNLGTFPNDTAFGKLKLRSMWGPLLLPSESSGQLIGAITVNGALHINNTSRFPVVSLLSSVEEILRLVCSA